MANILQTIFSNYFFNEICNVLIQISLKYVPKDATDNMPALVQIMDWHWTGNKPLSEPMMAYFTDAYVYASLSLNELTINSLPLAPGRFEWNFKSEFLKLILVIDGQGISCEIALRWMPLDLTDDKSTLIKVMAWCHQTTSHYLSQCWSRSMSPFGVTKPQWVNDSFSSQFYLSCEVN